MTRTPYAVARAALLALAGAVLVLAGAGPASAHAGLEASDPADGAVLTALPDRLTLTFTEAVLAGDDAVEVTGPDGDRLDVAVSTRRNRVLVDLGDPDAPVTGGSFTVDWQVTSGDDHEISGDLGFEVELPPSPTPSPTPTPAATATAPAVPPAAAPPGAGPGTGVDAVAGVAVVAGGLALLVLLAGSLLGAPRLRSLVRPAWAVVAVAGLVLVPVLRLRATDRALGEVTDLAVWFGGLLSWSGLGVVLVVAATGVLATRPARRGPQPPPGDAGRGPGAGWGS